MHATMHSYQGGSTNSIKHRVGAYDGCLPFLRRSVNLDGKDMELICLALVTVALFFVWFGLKCSIPTQADGE